MPTGVGPHFQQWSEGVTFTTENRVKLSYHIDGFAQFSGESGEKIISGIDQTTGKPKGLGLRSNPLLTPTWSGPVAAITVWGIDDYLTINDAASRTIVYEPDECYYRRYSPDEANGWILTIHTFSSNRNPLPVRFRNGFPYLHVAAESNPLSPLHYIVEYRLVDLQGPVILGLNLNRMVTKVDAKSGWMLSGPSEPGRTETTRYRLLAAYPRLTGQIASDGSLDRKQRDDQE